jgi:putative ABC transport system permease protein
LLAASPVTFPGYIQPGLDPRVTAFTVAISAFAALLLGLAPAVHVRAANLHDAVKQGGNRSIDSRTGKRFRSALAVSEVAFAMLLLVGAGLLMRTLQQLAAIRPGYDPAHLLVLRVSLPRVPQPSAPPATGALPPGDASTVTQARNLLAAVSHVPSVESVSASSDVPLSGGGAVFFTAEGQPPVNASNMPRAYTHSVTPGFFHTLHIRIVAGRAFTEQEVQDDRVMIVDEKVGKRFWPGQNPIGRRIKPGPPDSKSPWYTIVGVVNDMKYRGIPENPTADPDVFVPFAQGARNFRLVVRTPLDPAAVAPSVRAALRATDPTMVIFDVNTMNALIASQTSRSRFTGWLMAIFAAVALLLATIGIYGVIAYGVSRRTQEIGIRIALGAARNEVLRMVVARGMTMIVAGLVIGAAAALALTRLLSTLLYGVKPADLISFVAAALAMAAVALIACLIPASRATRIDPVIALRSE